MLYNTEQHHLLPLYDIRHNMKFYFSPLKIQIFSDIRCYPLAQPDFYSHYYDSSCDFLLENVYFYKGRVNTSEVMLFQS